MSADFHAPALGAGCSARVGAGFRAGIFGLLSLVPGPASEDTKYQFRVGDPAEPAGPESSAP